MEYNENNSQINTFTGGMNSDTSYQMMKDSEYTLAKNLRILSLNDTGSSAKQNGQGEIRPIEGIAECEISVKRKISENLYEDVDIVVTKILASGSIREYGVLIFEDKFGNWGILRFKNNIKTIPNANFSIDAVLVFGMCSDKLCGGGHNKVSITLYYEDGDDNIKLYIADGLHPIMLFNIHPNQDFYNYNLNGDLDKALSYPKIIFNKPLFVKMIPGSLKPGLVQYSYQLYDKNGVSTDISPATKLIPIGKVKGGSWENGNNVEGLHEDGSSEFGVQLQINIDSDYEYLSRIRVYRITYVENGQLPTIELIKDTTLSENQYNIYDDGVSALSLLSLEEYNSMTGSRIIPKVIESKDGRLFAADIIDKDISTIIDISEWDSRSFSFDASGYSHIFKSDGSESIITRNPSNISLKHDCYNKYTNVNLTLPENPGDDPRYTEADGYFDRFDKSGYYGGSGTNIDWRFVITELIADNSQNGIIGSTTIGNSANYILRTPFTSSDADRLKNAKKYYIKSTGEKEELSYRFDDQYIYQDSYRQSGTYSDTTVSTFAKSLRRDELYRYGIVFYDEFNNKTPVKWIADIRTPNMWYKGFETFESNPVGLYVRPLGIEFNIKSLPAGAVAYEIVRCNRSANDIATISQGVVSRPIQRHINKNEEYIDYPYTPTGFLTVARYWTGNNWEYRRGSNNDGKEADNFDNNSLFQFVSPEVSYTKDTIKDFLKNDTSYINTLVFLFGTAGLYNEDTYQIHDLQFGSVGPFPNENIMDADPTMPKVNPKVIQTIRPGISNCNLYLPYEGLQNGYFDAGINKYTLIDQNIYLPQMYFRITPTLSQDTIGTSSSDETEPAELYLGVYPTINGPVNAGNQSNIISVNSEKFLNLKNKVYAYIKLYEQSRYVHYIEDNLRFSMKTLAKAVVDKAVIAEEGGWSDMFENQSSSGQTSIVNKYTNFVTPIKTTQFCNFVTKGFYGEDLNRRTDYYNISRTDRNIFGAGGRCALLDISSWSTFPSNPQYDTTSKNLFSNTAAAINRRQEEQASASSEIPQSLTRNVCYALTKDDPQSGWTSSLSRFDWVGGTQNNPDYLVYRDSIAGTYLCNLRRRVNPYGGNDFTARSFNIYYSQGNYYKAAVNKAVVFDGDTFISPFEYVSMHKIYDAEDKQTLPSMTIVYSIPVETDINLAYTNGYEFSKNINDTYVSNLQIEPSKVYNTLVQEEPLYVYNTAYSSNNKTRIFSSEEEDPEHNKHLDYRCYYSDFKENDEKIDSWIRFRPANFLDVDTRFGAITNLRTFHNKLMYWQENAFGVFSVNERTTITDDSNMPLILGHGGILSRYDYLDNTSGMRKEDFCDTNSISTLYWFDNDNQEIKAYSDGGGVTQLSRVNRVQNIMHSKDETIGSTPIIPYMFYDPKYNEVINNVLSDRNSIVYNEQAQAFTSIYEIPFTGTCSFSNVQYLFIPYAMKIKGAVWNAHKTENPNTWNDNILSTYIQYVVNKNSSITKTYDTQQLVSVKQTHPSYPFKNIPLDIDYEVYYNKHHKYTWRTDLNSTESTLEHKITLREGNYRYDIPRALENGNTVDFGNRIRGKYMICSIEDTEPNINTSLSYVITKYRTSWT